jgi:hypothetical protein
MAVKSHQDTAETMQASGPAGDCDSDRADAEMPQKPGDASEVRLFICVEWGPTCGEV